jgi:hypothetical protein
VNIGRSKSETKRNLFVGNFGWNFIDDAGEQLINMSIQKKLPAKNEIYFQQELPEKKGVFAPRQTLLFKVL